MQEVAGKMTELGVGVDSSLKKMHRWLTPPGGDIGNFSDAAGVWFGMELVVIDSQHLHAFMFVTVTRGTARSSARRTMSYNNVARASIRQLLSLLILRLVNEVWCTGSIAMVQ